MTTGNRTGFIADVENYGVIEVDYIDYIDNFVKERLNRTYFVAECNIPYIDTRFIVVEFHNGIPGSVSDLLCTRCEADNEKLRLLERDYNECADSPLINSSELYAEKYLHNYFLED